MLFSARKNFYVRSGSDEDIDEPEKKLALQVTR